MCVWVCVYLCNIHQRLFWLQLGLSNISLAMYTQTGYLDQLSVNPYITKSTEKIYAGTLHECKCHFQDHINWYFIWHYIVIEFISYKKTYLYKYFRDNHSRFTDGCQKCKFKLLQLFLAGSAVELVCKGL